MDISERIEKVTKEMARWNLEIGQLERVPLAEGKENLYAAKLGVLNGLVVLGSEKLLNLEEQKTATGEGLEGLKEAEKVLNQEGSVLHDQYMRLQSWVYAGDEDGFEKFVNQEISWLVNNARGKKGGSPSR